MDSHCRLCCPPFSPSPLSQPAGAEEPGGCWGMSVAFGPIVLLSQEQHGGPPHVIPGPHATEFCHSPHGICQSASTQYTVVQFVTHPFWMCCHQDMFQIPLYQAGWRVGAEGTGMRPWMVALHWAWPGSTPGSHTVCTGGLEG